MNQVVNTTVPADLTSTEPTWPGRFKTSRRIHPSIRSRLLLLLLAMTLPFLAFMLVSVMRQAADDKSVAQSRMLGIARLTSARLDDHVGEIEKILSVLSSVVGTDDASIDKNEAILRSIAPHLPSALNNLSLWAADGHSLGSLDVALRTSGINAASRRFFADASTSASVAIEAPVESLSNGKLVGIFALRIERGGRFAGVVTVAAQLDSLQGVLAPDDAVPPGSVITVIDANSVVLARSIDPDKWIGKTLPGVSSIGADAMRQHNGVLEGRSRDGIVRIAGFSVARKVPWLVYVGIPTEVAMAPAGTRLLETLLAGSAMLLAGLMLATWMGGRISKPLRQLSADAATFGVGGQLSHRSRVAVSGEIGALVATFNEMAEVLQTRTALLETSRKDLCRLACEQRAMLHTDLIGIIKFKDRHIVWANAGAERVLGYEAGELFGQSSRALCSSEATWASVTAQALPELSAGRGFRSQHEMMRKDGHAVWLDMLATVLQNEAGETMVMLVDITLQKRAEETRIRSRTLESENRQLFESNRLKNLFLANMSHELHTPLNAIIGYAHILKGGSITPESPRFLRYLGSIDSSGKQLLTLIDSMLNLAKLESGRLELHPRAVDLPSLVDDVVEMLRDDARRKRIDVSVDVSTSIGEIVTDPIRLTQVLSHLLSNAIRFSHDGGRVKLRASPDGFGDFKVTVEDTGIGIADKDLPRLFSAFQQLSEGNRKSFGGVGLGLALVRKLVEAQGGQVAVRSREGIGSVFTFVLPKQPEMAAA